MTSSAVSGLPLWKVMPCLIRIVHSVALALGVSSSASTFTGCASGVSPTSGSYRLSILEKSTLVMALSGFRVSAVDPPVSPARSWPPGRGLPTLEAVNALIVLPVPQALSSPPAPTASEPARPALRKSLRLKVMSASRRCVKRWGRYESGCRGIRSVTRSRAMSSRCEHNVHNVI